MRHHINVAQVFTSVQPGHLLNSFGNERQEQPANIVIPDAALTTDIGNSIRFINGNRSTACYCIELNSWAIWSGSHWEIDSCGRIMTIGGRTILNIMQEVEGQQSHDTKTELINCCKRSQSPARINAMLTLAAPEMAISWSAMDTDTFLLNVQNGTIDLRTGVLLSHNPAHMNSKISPITHDAGAECPRLMQYLESAFPDNPEMIDYMQKVVGYILTGDTSEKCFFIFYGPGGNNGKSVLINVLRYILGPYALQTPVATLQRKNPGGNSNDIVRLKGARFVAASEIDPKQRYQFDEALLKMLTGNDPVAARELFKEYIEYYPEFKLFIGTNTQPEFDTKDTALMDRVMTIPFRVSFPRDHAERDNDLLASLKAEAPGILNWAIEGCLLWQSEGLGAVPDEVTFNLPNTVRDATIDRFLHECCDFQEGSVQKCGVLHDTYKAWCLDLNTLPVGNATFSKRLTNHHKLDKDTIGSDGTFWFGITLKEAMTGTVAA
ncbi:MAG: phage/plasmid primase, P4 family [Desulfuromonadaceae bacterium]|nr:phage/plasmid primase, P4 family [Desulfuromonadaceae bacterium]MDD2847633.1 phage/plasmid primase, P4 family [Desulfuromonadaceae bacterium]MDD4131121.1 phage/plasmid primase, P4 family [Desulfuromonadaceae bacterium]